VAVLGWAAVGRAAAEPEATSPLVAALSQGSEGERIRAASRLYHLGHGDLGVVPLARELEAEDPAHRCLAARLLGVLRSRAATAALIRAASDPDPAVRRDAAEALGQLRAPEATPALVGLLADGHAGVRIGAARALGELGGADVGGPLIRAIAREEDAEVRLHLVEALSDLHVARADRALGRALDDPSEPVRVLAASHLVERGDRRAGELLAARLGSPSARVRIETAESLARSNGRAAELARERLAASLDDREAEVGLAAAVALARLADPRGIPHLEAVARSAASPTLQSRARELLQRLSEQHGERDAGTVPPD
jgi:hypothetical protein